MSGRATLTIVTSIETRNIETEVMKSVAHARPDSVVGLRASSPEEVTAVTSGTVRPRCLYSTANAGRWQQSPIKPKSRGSQEGSVNHGASVDEPDVKGGRTGVWNSRSL